MEGEPGCGKTGLAAAVTYEFTQKYLENQKNNVTIQGGEQNWWDYYIWNIKSTSRARDGLYRYDAVARLRDAQLIGTDPERLQDFLGIQEVEYLKKRLQDKKNYREFGDLGKALKEHDYRPILLIDEIDKADSNFANDLLFELDQLRFKVQETRLKELANFMSDYIANRLQIENNDRALVLGERPNWTALAYLSADGTEAVNAIKSELQKLTTSADAQERIKWAALVENYADLLSEKGFEPLLLKWAQDTLEAQPIQDDEEMEIAAAMGVELKPFEYDVAVINPDTQDDESEDELKSFEFETGFLSSPSLLSILLL